MDDDYADIYYVDSRNAVTRDHRHNRPGQRPGWPGWIGRPTASVQYVPPAASRPIYQPAAQPQVVYQPAPPPVMYGPPQSTAAMMLGKLTTGQIVEMVAQIFAALQSLPNAPVSTRDVETDLGNLILYQGALANHAKRDEQVRTLGSLVAKLVG